MENIKLDGGESEPEQKEYIIKSNNTNYKLLITLNYNFEIYELKVCEINFIPKFNYEIKYNFNDLKVVLKLEDKYDHLESLMNFFDEMYTKNKIKLIHEDDSVLLIINSSKDTSKDNELKLKLEKKSLNVNDKFDFIINEINNIKNNNLSLIEKRFDEIMKRLNDIESSINNKIKNCTGDLNLLKNEFVKSNSLKNNNNEIQELKTEIKNLNNLIIEKKDIYIPNEIKTAKDEIKIDDFEIIEKDKKKLEKKDKVDKNKKEKNIINNNEKNININNEIKNEIKIENNINNKIDKKISSKKSIIINKKPSFKNDLKIVKLFEPDDDKTQLFFFAILIGESGVGKTWIFNNFFTLPYAQSPSLSLESEEIFFKIEDNTLISLNIVVCPNIKIFNQPKFISSKDIIIFVYSIDDRNSFENLKEKINEIKTKSKKNANFILVGNKVDLENKRIVKKEEGENLAKDENLDLFLEVSAKNGNYIDKIFFDACKILYKSRVINE